MLVTTYGVPDGTRTVIGTFEARCRAVVDAGPQPVRLHGVFSTPAFMYFTFELLADVHGCLDVVPPVPLLHVEVVHHKRRGRELEKLLKDWLGVSNGPRFTKPGGLEALAGREARLTLGWVRGVDAAASDAPSLRVMEIDPA